MLSGLSLGNLPTAANLSSLAAQQIQTTASSNTATADKSAATGSATSTASSNADNSKASNQVDNSSDQQSTATTNRPDKVDNQSNQNKSNDDASSNSQDTKNFKTVMDKTVADTKTKDSSNTTSSTDAKADDGSDEADQLDAEDMAAVVSSVLATITNSLADASKDIEIKLDLSDLSINQLDTVAKAVGLVDEQVQTMMNQTIDEISSVNMTDLDTLVQKSEMLDDLQSVHEELLENLDEIGYQQSIQEDSSAVQVQAQVTTVASSDDQGVTLEGMTEVKPEQYQTANIDLKSAKDSASTQEDTTSDQSELMTNLEQFNQIKAQDSSKQLVAAKQVEIERVDIASVDQSKNANTVELSKNTTVAVEFKKQDDKKNDSFLDKIQFISIKEDKSATKTQLTTKVDLDTKTQQTLIQAADEIKSFISDRVESRSAQPKSDEGIIDVSADQVDVTDNGQNNMFGKLINETFKHLNIAKPEAAPALSPKQVLNLVHDKVMAAPVNTQEVLRFQLHPKDLGKITITINREATGVTIHMEVDNDAAVSSLKQDMSSLSSALKDKGLELKDIDISNSSSESTSSQQQQRGDFNEAREEQKKRMSEDQPFWLQEDTRPSFEKQLKGMLNTWRHRV